MTTVINYIPRVTAVAKERRRRNGMERWGRKPPHVICGANREGGMGGDNLSLAVCTSCERPEGRQRDRRQ